MILTTRKRAILDREIERYTQATRYVIRSIRLKHLAAEKRAEKQIIEALQEEFCKQFHSSQDYLRDVVRTAVVTIAHYRKRVARTGTSKEGRPIFKGGQIILSPPLLTVGDKGVILQTETLQTKRLFIPFDPAIIQQHINILQRLKEDMDVIDRIRLTPQPDGSVMTDIRIRADQDIMELLQNVE